MPGADSRVLLLTGRPGVGKTTVVRRVADELDGGVAGFYTEEIRDDEGRKGFRIVGLDGWRAVMAHVDRAGEPRVSRYGVDVEVVEEAVARMPRPEGGDAPLFVVDEIGKMECLSERFVAWIRSILDSDARLLASVARRGGGLVAEVKEHPDAEVLEVSRRNRDRMPGRILERLGEA